MNKLIDKVSYIDETIGSLNKRTAKEKQEINKAVEALLKSKKIAQGNKSTRKPKTHAT